MEKSIRQYYEKEKETEIKLTDSTYFPANDQKVQIHWKKNLVKSWCVKKSSSKDSKDVLLSQKLLHNTKARKNIEEGL